MDAAISVSGVSKKYSRNANAHLGYSIGDLMRELSGRRRTAELRPDEFWAVKDVSFDLYPGDSMALVGRNGAGKSTLLKMMNGLTKPSAGRITLRGRIQALINLGTGFNPNLSGMDNIFNAGALMGMKAREIKGRIEEIVEFAELGEFIDSPTGTYSTGMKARLGFAVAVNLSPDILLIDEVLAVGDFAFQNKCFTHMEQLKKQGVTIVFVSHSHNRVIKLCERAIWLHGGVVKAAGTSLETVQAYLAFLDANEEARVRNAAAKRSAKEWSAAAKAMPSDLQPDDVLDTDEAWIKKSVARSEGGLYGPVVDSTKDVDDIKCDLVVDGQPADTVPVHSAVEIHFSFRLKRRVEGLCSTLVFFRKDGLRVAAIATLRDGRLKHIHEGRVRCVYRIPDFDLVPGEYVIMMPIAEGQGYLWRDVVKEFYVSGGGDVYVGIKDIRHEYEIRVD